jgi:DNA-binding SARP family transcriptional activator
VQVLFNVLGPLEVRVAGARVEFGRKPAAVLALLLLHANSWVTLDAIVDALWEGDAPVSADRNVRTYVWQLRHRVPPAAGGARIQSRPGSYRIVVEPAELDALAVAELAAGGRQALAGGDPALARERFAAALGLWRGGPYGELSGDAARIAAAGLTELRWELRQRLADALLELGEPAEAVTLLRPLTTEEPLREGLWTALVRALHRAGRRGEALAAFRQAHRLLRDELGVEPGAELREAHREALAGAEPARPAGPRPVEPRRTNSLPRDVPDFVGRVAELAALRSLAGDAGPAVRVALIDGMAGAGKTALAVHVAHQLASCYPDAQLYVDLCGHAPAGDPVDPAEALAGLLRAVGLDRDLPPGTEERAALWRSVLADRQVLLVLDDAAGAAQVRPLLPGDGRSLVLVTSRVRLAALDGAEGVTLGMLSAREALRLLGAAAGSPRVDREQAAAAEVVRQCGQLPAAIRIAAAWLRRRPAWTVALLAEWLAEEPGRLTALRAEDRSLESMFAGSCDRLPPAARRLFRLLGLAGGRDVDVAAAAALAGTDLAAAEPVLEHLLDQHLLDQQAAGTYALHPLLAAYGCQLALAEEPLAERRAALGRLIRHRRRPQVAEGWTA